MDERRRIVFAFDDQDEVDLAVERLRAAGLPPDQIEMNAPQDDDLAFIDERGDSAEHFPETTLAVEVSSDETEDVLELIRDLEVSYLKVEIGAEM